MHPCEGAARDVPGQFTGQLEGVVAHTGTVNAHQQSVYMAHVEIVTHQQHRPGGELKDVLACAVGQDGLQSTKAAGAHHDQVCIKFIGHLQHGLLGVALAQDRVYVGRI